MVPSIFTSDLNDDDIDYFSEQWNRSWSSSPRRTPNSATSCRQFLIDAKARLDGRLFVAKDCNGPVIGGVACQVWSGPVPIEVVDDSSLKLGAIWGLAATSGDPIVVSKALIQSATMYLRRIGCHKILMVGNESMDLSPFTDCGYAPRNLLSAKLFQLSCAPSALSTTKGDCVQLQMGGPQYDSTVCKHWRKMWKEVGIEELSDNLDEITTSFIQNARTRLKYQTFVALIDDDTVVGSLSCQILTGTFPLEVDSKPDGTIWAVYVHPEYRRNGIATALLHHSMRYLSSVGCQNAVLVAASDEGQRVYERMGFSSANCLVCDLSKADSLEQCLEKHSVHPLRFNPRAIRALATATIQQLLAAFKEDRQCKNIVDAIRVFQQGNGQYIDPHDNWLTRNVNRMGRGFDAASLAANKSELVRKFDRLASKYDEWTVGNRSKVEHFVAQCASRRFDNRKQKCARVLDVAAGIGLQGQMLRILGFEGELVGIDVSPAMVSKIDERGCYDLAFVADANEDIHSQIGESSDSSQFDVVICTGAMELLNQERALSNITRVLKDGGELWVSFQLDGIATQHQNITGVSKDEALEMLKQTGFSIVSSELCHDAFYTPSPKQDGSMSPVPYLFVLARLSRP